MTRRKKERVSSQQATPNTSESTKVLVNSAPSIKGFIITLALWGWLPVGLVDYLIYKGVQHDE